MCLARNSKSSLGFTLIELLIVIAILGILAVAVLSVINPIEQINRGRDTGSKSDAEQLIGATERYYAFKGYYPWQLGASSLNVAITPMVEVTTAAQTFGGDAQPLLTNISTGATSEVKSAFISRITSATYRRLSIYHRGTSGDSTYVCYKPQSGAFRDEAWSRCKAGGLPTDFPTTGCPADNTCTNAANADTATGCYLCLP